MKTVVLVSLLFCDSSEKSGKVRELNFYMWVRTLRKVYRCQQH